MQHNEALQQTGVNEGLYKGTHIVLFLMSHLSQLAYGRDGKGGDEEQEKRKASHISKV